MMRMLVPLATTCGRRLEIPSDLPIGATLGLSSDTVLRVCA